MRLKLLAKVSRREGTAISNRTAHAKALTRRGYAPGVHGPNGNTRLTDYGKQLREKQKAKRIYGLNERQFQNMFREAKDLRGNSGQKLVEFLERRLDNVVYRLGFSKTRAAARQVVSHAHISVNGKTVNIPSYRVRSGDVIQVRENKRAKGVWKGVQEVVAKREMPSWLTIQSADWSGKVTSTPQATEFERSFDPQLIVEFYSRQ